MDIRKTLFEARENIQNDIMRRLDGLEEKTLDDVYSIVNDIFDDVISEFESENRLERFFVRCFIPIEDEEPLGFTTEEEAIDEMVNLEEMYPENRYEVYRVNKDGEEIS